MMLPPQVTIVPIYVLWTNAGLVGTIWPLDAAEPARRRVLDLPAAPVPLTIPVEYTDAARMDGCSEWQVLRKVILPMARPAVAATAMFLFFYCWNDYYGPLLYTNHVQENWTLSLGLAHVPQPATRCSGTSTMAATLAGHACR